jgi:NAD(P)-dependent dehydrogenase (short-subunit alcohol dehydrogenase family)
MNTHKTALVTGASSGLGFETAAQLAEAGFDRIIVSGRTEAKAEDAEQRLESRTGRRVFEPVATDLGELRTVEAASDELKRRGNGVDVLILNAGLISGRELTRNDEGIEQTFAPLVGHHLLTMRLVEHGLLSDGARIVLSGSEAARGDVFSMETVDLPAFALDEFDGDLGAAAEALARSTPPVTFNSSNAYANAKLFAVWWAGALSRRLPAGSTVNSVSPGSTPDTNAARDQGFIMRKVMLPALTAFGDRFGMAHDISTGAGRYVEVIGFDDNATGKFYASPPKKMTGPLHEYGGPRFTDQTPQEAVWNTIVALAGGVDYPN